MCSTVRVYYDDFENIKNFKFKDFLNLNEKIKYIEPEQAFELILSHLNISFFIFLNLITFHKNHHYDFLN